MKRGEAIEVVEAHPAAQEKEHMANIVNVAAGLTLKTLTA